MNDYSAARTNMVEGQIKPNRVTDVRLMERFGEVPRERFVPGPLRATAYVDEDLPIGGGRYMMEPMVLARLLDAADLAPSDIVLTLGAGSGYAAAIMAGLCSTVVGIEPEQALVSRATETLADLQIDNAVIIEGDLSAGYPDQAPFNVIVFEGAIASVPENVLSQLADDGRLVAVVNDGRGGLGDASLWLKTSAGVGKRPLFEAGTPHLPGFTPIPTFEF